MSLIISAMKGRRGILAGDTRVVDENEKVLDDNGQKIFKISKYTAIGFTGSYELALELKNVLECQSDVKYADEVRDFSYRYLYRQSRYNPMDLNCIVIGITSWHWLKQYWITKPEGIGSELESYEEHSTPFKFSYMCAGYDTYMEHLDEMIQEYRFNSFKDMDDLANRYIQYGSSQSHTINNKLEIIHVKWSIFQIVQCIILFIKRTIFG